MKKRSDVIMFSFDVYNFSSCVDDTMTGVGSPVFKYDNHLKSLIFGEKHQKKGHLIRSIDGSPTPISSKDLSGK